MLGKLFIILNTALIAHPLFQCLFSRFNTLSFQAYSPLTEAIVYKAGKASTHFLIRN